MAGPLEGLLVVDASWGMPGAVTSMVFADYGARVVKVERPGGGPDRESSNRKAWDRGKWSIELDVHDAADAVMLRALLDRADIYIESFGVDRADAVGLGYEQVRATNQRLVQCSISAYGLDPHPWRDRPGWDALVAARMGFMAEQPGHRPSPVFLGHPSVGYTTAFLATIGTLAALRARWETGRGQRVDVSILDGVLGQAPMNWWWNERDDSYLTTEEKGTFGNRRVIMDIFKCADGEHLMVHTGGDGAFKATMDLLGLGESIEDVSGRVEIAVPLNEEETRVTRDLVRDAWLARPRDEWLDLLTRADVASVPVLRPGEVFEHPQVRHAGVEITVPDEEHGLLRQIGPCIHFADVEIDSPEPAPALGAHNARVEELLRSPVREAASTGRVLRHALDGLRVLDFSQYFAAAYGVKKFSDLGADVIKIETPSRDPMRSLPDPFEGAQRGKRSITLDLRTEAGRQIVHELVRTADVVVHNMRPGKAEAIGIGYEDLRAINPTLIYCYQPGWGASGPSKDRKSFAPLMSGLTGLMYEAAGEGNLPVRRARASEDYYGALMGAVGMLIALERRNRTGEGQYLESPQLHASLFTTTEQQLDGEGRLVTANMLDQQQLGYGPLYRLYRTADGWLCIACVGDRAFARLVDALDLDDALPADRFGTAKVRQSEAELLSTILAARLAELTTEEAFSTLDGQGVACEVAKAEPYMPEFFWQEWAVETGRVFEHHHDEIGWIREIGMVMRLSETPGLKKGPGPLFGEHTREVLAELGYADDTIADLVASGVCQAVGG